MVNGVRSNTAGMDENGVTIVKDAGELSEIITDLDNSVNSLMEIWHGDAGKTFEASHKVQQANLSNFNDLLQELGTAVRRASSILADAEMENAGDAGNMC